MSPDTKAPRVPDLVLERYRLNELPPKDVAEVDDLLQRDDALRQRLTSLDQSDQDLRREQFPEQLAEGIRQRIGARKTARPAAMRTAYWALPAALVAATLLVTVVVPRMASAPDSDRERIKGLVPALTLYRQTAAGSETLADGAIAHTGDVIRVGYRAAGRTHGIILSVDGQGTVTMHLPSDGDRAAPLARGSTVLLDHAYELDDAPLWERFYFVTGETPFSVAPVLDAARRAATNPGHPSTARLALPAGLDQSAFSLQKEARP